MYAFPIIVILISSIVSIKATGSWFSPGSFFSNSWLFFTIIPLLSAPEYSINYYGIWFIALLVMSLSSGSVFASLFNINTNSFKLEKIHILYKKLYYPLILINLISIFGIMYLMIYVQSIYVRPYYFNDWMSIPNLISIDRYDGELNYPGLIKYSLYFIYPGNIISGMLITETNISIKNKFIFIISIVLSIILGIIEGSRTSIMLGGILFISGWIGARVKLHEGKLNLSFVKTIIFFGLIFGLFLFLFISVQWLRQGLDPIIFSLLFERVKAYFFGYLSAFTLWYGTIENIFPLKIQMSTFAGPMNLIGILERDLGFYEPVLIDRGISTNIFTALRGLVSDFSIIGSLVIGFLIGIFFQFQFQKKTNDSFDGIIALSIFYAFTLYSPLISIFHYNSIFFSWALVYLLLKFNISQ